MEKYLKNQEAIICREKKTQNGAWWLPSNLWEAPKVVCGEIFALVSQSDSGTNKWMLVEERSSSLHWRLAVFVGSEFSVTRSMQVRSWKTIVLGLLTNEYLP